ncbi:MAG TPA: glycosyltransferase family 2 protein [Bryobacteraceae bacterium]
MADSSVSVVIPTWNQSRLVDKVLQSLKRQTILPVETIVVDNGSHDETLLIAESHGATVIALAANCGFAAAVNKGIEAAHGDWILIVNNDVELDSRWLEFALQAANEEGSSIAGGKLVQANDPKRIDGTWDLVAASGCAWRCGWNALDGELWNERRTGQLLSFTAILVHRRVLRAVGLLDERYESYYEDVDFAIRCALAGFTGVYEPKARATHIGSATLGSSARTIYFVSRNQILLASKFGLNRLSRSRVLAGQALFVFARLRQGSFFAALRGKWDGIWLKRGERPFVCDPVKLQTLLSEQEKQICDYQKQLGWDLSWKMYFRMLGCGYRH